MTTKSIHSTYISVGIIIFLIALLGLNLHLNSLSNLNSLNQNVYIKSMNMVNENHDRLLQIINKEPIFTNLSILDMETVNGFRPKCVWARRSSLIESDDVVGDFKRIQELLLENQDIFIANMRFDVISFYFKNGLYDKNEISIEDQSIFEKFDDLWDMPGIIGRVILVDMLITIDKNMEGCLGV